MEEKLPTPTSSQDTPPAEPMPSEEEYQVNEKAITPFEGDYMEVTIDVADHLAKYEKAIDAIMNFIIKRTYAGDWVSHDKATTPLEERTVNMIGAAAERVARDLGIQESNRTSPAKKFHDQEKHPGHYYFECEGDFTFRGRKVHAVGRASTINPFHLAKAKGNVGAIREEYLVQECWRDCTKNGIRMWFGLRKIPILKLKELGYDIQKVKFVNFGEGAESQSAKNPEATAKPKEDKEVLSASIEIKLIKFRKWNETPIMDVVDKNDETYSWWGKGAESEEAKKLASYRTAGYLVEVNYSIQKGKYKNIESIGEGVPQ